MNNNSTTAAYTVGRKVFYKHLVYGRLKYSPGTIIGFLDRDSGSIQSIEEGDYTMEAIPDKKYYLRYGNISNGSIKYIVVELDENKRKVLVNDASDIQLRPTEGGRRTLHRSHKKRHSHKKRRHTKRR